MKNMFLSKDCYVKIIAIQGLLYSFDNEGPEYVIGSFYQNGSWTKMSSKVDIDPSNSSPVTINVIPYFVRI